jgi:AbrB family looped-hinge helix DNA binding protein
LNGSITGYYFYFLSDMQPTLTTKGQVTIPRAMRQHFGLQPGVAVQFAIEGDHIALRPAPSLRDAPESGFALIRSRRKSVPADFDVASLAEQP